MLRRRPLSSAKGFRPDAQNMRRETVRSKMIKQLIMTEAEFEEAMDGAKRNARVRLSRELCEDLWKHLFPLTDYNRNESLDTLWPKFLNRVIECSKQARDNVWEK